MGKFFKRKKKSKEEVHHPPFVTETCKMEKKKKRHEMLFKRGKINPHTLYNTLVFLSQFFHHREEEWEEFLRLIIDENQSRKPDYDRVNMWFHDKFHVALNQSETKYLCRYVRFNSTSDDKEQKLRESMDNIDIPPAKYESWANEVITLLEFDNDLDLNESVDNMNLQGFIASKVHNLWTAFQSLHRRFYILNNKRVHVRIERRMSDSRLTLSNKRNVGRYRRSRHETSDFAAATHIGEDKERDLNDDMIRTF